MAFLGEFGFFDVRPDPRFWRDLASQAAITNGTTDVPFNVQWIGRAPWLFSARNLGFWGYGWGLLISGALGVVFALLSLRQRGLRQRDWRQLDEQTPVLLASALFCLVLFGVQGATFSKFTRYFLPMTPFMALLAAYAWQKLASRATGRAGVAASRAAAGRRFYGAVVRGGRFDLHAPAHAFGGLALDRGEHRAGHGHHQRNAVGRRFAAGLGAIGHGRFALAIAGFLRRRHARKARAYVAVARPERVAVFVVGPQLAKHPALARKVAADFALLLRAMERRFGLGARARIHFVSAP